MNITQLINADGNAVKNQFVVQTTKGTYFKSYNTLIAFIPKNGGCIKLTSKWDCSQTTLKHLKTFLGISDSKAEIQKQIDQGNLLILDDKLCVK